MLYVWALCHTQLYHPYRVNEVQCVVCCQCSVTSSEQTIPDVRAPLHSSSWQALTWEYNITRATCKDRPLFTWDTTEDGATRFLHRKQKHLTFNFPWDASVRTRRGLRWKDRADLKRGRGGDGGQDGGGSHCRVLLDAQGVDQVLHRVHLAVLHQLGGVTRGKDGVLASQRGEGHYGEMCAGSRSAEVSCRPQDSLGGAMTSHRCPHVYTLAVTPVNASFHSLHQVLADR